MLWIMLASLPITLAFRFRGHTLSIRRIAQVYDSKFISTRCSTSLSSNKRSVVILEQGKAKLFQDGNPLVYGGAIQEVKGDPSIGDDVDVTDYKGNLVGRGFFNPLSQYRVRMMSRGYEDINSASIEDLLEFRLAAAIDLRKQIGLPSDVNTVYRVVVQSTAVWVELRKDMIMSLLSKLLGSDSILLWRRAEARLKQDGFVSSAVTTTDKDTMQETSTLDDNIIVFENGVKFNVNTENSQKTGFYCDQRDNRMMIAAMSKGKTVLDLYCYSAGFSVYAAKNGAMRCVAVDSSESALETARLNALANGVQDTVEIVKAECVEYMQSCIQQKALFDVVICDPPKLAPTRKDLVRATGKYTRINTNAMQLVKPGGLLLTCSCSAAMTQSGEFTSVLREAARISRRDVTVLGKYSAGADHPVHVAYPESAYLTAVLLRVQ